MSKWIMVFDSVKGILKRTIYSMPSSDGATGSVLTTDGLGGLSWTSPDLSIISTFFDISGSPQTTFTADQSLVGKIVNVYLNGVMQRVGNAGQFDYYISGASVIFNSTVPIDASVRLDLVSIGSSNIYYYNAEVTASSQSVFDTAITLEGRLILIYVNGVIQRIGVDYDFTISGTVLTFTSPLPQYAWVHVMVQS
jgi:hypothetical protein